MCYMYMGLGVYICIYNTAVCACIYIYMYGFWGLGLGLRVNRVSKQLIRGEFEFLHCRALEYQPGFQSW